MVASAHRAAGAAVGRVRGEIEPLVGGAVAIVVGPVAQLRFRHTRRRARVTFAGKVDATALDAAPLSALARSRDGHLEAEAIEALTLGALDE